MTIDSIIEEIQRQIGQQTSNQYPKYLLVNSKARLKILEVAREMNFPMPETICGLKILESDFVETIEVK